MECLHLCAQENCDCNNAHNGSPCASIESPTGDDDAFCQGQNPRRIDCNDKFNMAQLHKELKQMDQQSEEDKNLYRPCPPPDMLPPPLTDIPTDTDRYVPCEVRPDGPHGKTLVVLEDVRRGQPVIKFGGPIWNREEYERCEDYGHCLQIGANTFLGPYDGPDDYTDHSCDPTCYIVNREDKEAVLVALKDMKAGDRVTFDYATTLFQDYRFDCRCDCGADNCRGVIHDFTLMTDDQQKDLFERGVLPKFIVDWYLNKPVDPIAPPTNM